MGDATVLALCAEADRELDSLYSRVRCEFLQNEVRRGQSQADAVAAFLRPRLHWLKDGQAINEQRLNWNARHYIERMKLTGMPEFYQRLASAALLLAEDPDRLAPVREWVSSLAHDNMPSEERRHAITLLLRFEQAVRGRKRRHAGWQPVPPGRDEVIRYTVELVAKAFKLNKTRTGENRKVESACSLVAAALKKLGIRNLKESAVNEIWRQRPQAACHKQIK